MSDDKLIRIPAEATPYDAYKELEPTVLQMIRLMSTCPIGTAGRTGLAMLVTTAFFAVLCDMELEHQGRPRQLRSNIMREMADLMVAALSNDGKPTLSVVPSPQEARDG